MNKRDSTESIPKRLPVSGRTKTSIYVDKGLWAWFVKWVRENHTSTCHILEPFIYALQQSEGRIQDQIGLRTPLPKIDLTLNLTREVQRHRRRENVRTGSVWSDWGNHLRCYFCNRPTKWIVIFTPGPDRSIRIWTCGLHKRPYQRIDTSKGFPKVFLKKLYKETRASVRSITGLTDHTR